jgi:hypothetical protein
MLRFGKIGSTPNPLLADIGKSSTSEREREDKKGKDRKGR